MVDINRSLIDIYLQMTENLDSDSKLELISGLIDSMKNANEKADDSFLKLYGSLKTDESAEELIKRTITARNFNRKIESFE